MEADKRDARCPCCTEKYSTDDDARLPIVLSCLCRICKGCALQQEAEIAAAAAGSGKKKKGKGKGKKKKKEEEKVVQHNGMACQICEKVCTTPVADLLVDIAMLKALQSSTKDAAEIPLCEFCASERATKYCGDCAMQRMLCDYCHTGMHRSAQKQGHTSIPIEEHLASAASNDNGGGSAAHQPTTMCSIHAGQPLKFHCNTCNILVCAECGILEHNGHDFTPVEQAADAHRETIEAALAAVTVTRAEVVAAIAAIKVIKGQLQGNKDAANKVIEEGFKKLMRAAKERKDALQQLVQGAYSEKLAALEAQLSALEDVDSNSEAALTLVEATVAAATATELLARSSLLENGLGQLQAHGVALDECRGATIRMVSDVTFEHKVAETRALGEIETADTNPAASTAAGDGLKYAAVGNEATFVVTAIEVGAAGKKPRTSGGDDVELRFVCVGGNGKKEASTEINRGGGGAAAAAKNGKRKRGKGLRGLGGFSDNEDDGQEVGLPQKKGRRGGLFGNSNIDGDRGSSEDDGQEFGLPQKKGRRVGLYGNSNIYGDRGSASSRNSASYGTEFGFLGKAAIRKQPNFWPAFGASKPGRPVAMALGAFNDSQPASSSDGGPRLTSKKPRVDFKEMASQLKDHSKRPPPVRPAQPATKGRSYGRVKKSAGYAVGSSMYNGSNATSSASDDNDFGSVVNDVPPPPFMFNSSDATSFASDDDDFGIEVNVPTPRSRSKMVATPIEMVFTSIQLGTAHVPFGNLKRGYAKCLVKFSEDHVTVDLALKKGFTIDFELQLDQCESIQEDLLKTGRLYVKLAGNSKEADELRKFAHSCLDDGESRRPFVWIALLNDNIMMKPKSADVRKIKEEVMARWKKSKQFKQPDWVEENAWLKILKPQPRSSGRAGAKRSKTGASTSSSGGGGAAAASNDDVDADADFDNIVADNGDGTYWCSYTVPEGAETKQWQLQVLLNGKQIAGSPFAVEVACVDSWPPPPPVSHRGPVWHRGPRKPRLSLSRR